MSERIAGHMANCQEDAPLCLGCAEHFAALGARVKELTVESISRGDQIAHLTGFRASARTRWSARCRADSMFMSSPLDDPGGRRRDLLR